MWVQSSHRDTTEGVALSPSRGTKLSGGVQRSQEGSHSSHRRPGPNSVPTLDNVTLLYPDAGGPAPAHAAARTPAQVSLAGTEGGGTGLRVSTCSDIQ